MLLHGHQVARVRSTSGSTWKVSDARRCHWPPRCKRSLRPERRGRTASPGSDVDTGRCRQDIWSSPPARCGSGATVLRVYGEYSVPSMVEAFGPSLVLLLAVLIAGSMVRKVGAFRKPGFPLRADTIGLRDVDPLEVALDGAVAMNSFSSHDRVDPTLTLQAVVRFAPSDYSVVKEIVHHFRRREVISIDLANMERGQAVRLVDFCSGMTAMCSGWVLRVADRVIVLTPPV